MVEEEDLECRVLECRELELELELEEEDWSDSVESSFSLGKGIGPELVESVSIRGERRTGRGVTKGSVWRLRESAKGAEG